MHLFVFGPSTKIPRSIRNIRNIRSSSTYDNYLESFVKLVATLRHTKSTCTVVEQSCGGLISASILMQPGASQCYIGSSIIYNTKKCQPLLVSSVDQSTGSNRTLGYPPVRNATNQNPPPAPVSLPQLFRDQLPLADRNIIFPIIDDDDDDDEVQNYIQSKIQWTAQMAIQYCTSCQTDYAIAEGGAVGPTFRPNHLHHGFSVIAIAGRRRQNRTTNPDDVNQNKSSSDDRNHHDDTEDDTVSILRQEIVFSSLPSSSSSRIQNMYAFAQVAANICQDVAEMEHGNEATTNTTTTESMLDLSSISSQLPPPRPAENAMLTNITFDRSALRIRTNLNRLDELWYTSNHTKFIVLYNNKILIHKAAATATADESMEVAYLQRTELLPYFLGIHIPFFDKCSKDFHQMHAISFLGTLEEQQQQQTLNSTAGGDIRSNHSTIVPNNTVEAIFAIDLSTIFRTMNKEHAEQQQLLSAIMKNDRMSFVDTRSTLPLMSNQNDQEIVLYGTALTEWKRRNKFCSSCGSVHLSFRENGGTVGECGNCHNKFWPRQDPSMIVLIISRDRQRALLANHVRHQHKKIYTTLAGFVEVGETMEGAVVREVYEETGIRVDTNVPMQYIGTQPWPFPQSCMIGFIATADDRSQHITIDASEIHDARWFSKEEIMAATSVVGSTLQTQVTETAFRQNPNLSCVIPPKGVIARKLIDTWLAEEQGPAETDDVGSLAKFLHDDATTLTSAKHVHRIKIT